MGICLNPIVQKLITKYPDLTFRLKYWEGGVGFNYDQYITVRGGSGGKTFSQGIGEGRVSMNGKDLDGKRFSHIVLYENGRIKDRKYCEAGRVLYHIVRTNQTIMLI